MFPTASAETQAEDESIANTALLLLLEAVGRLCRPANVEWTMHRIPLKATFTKAKFTAIADGSLRSLDLYRILGSIEVKKVPRSPQNQDTIR